MHSLAHHHQHMHQRTHRHAFTPILHQSSTILPAPHLMGTQDSSVRRCVSLRWIITICLVETEPIKAPKNKFLPFTSHHSSMCNFPEERQGRLLLPSLLFAQQHRSPSAHQWVHGAWMKTDWTEESDSCLLFKHKKDQLWFKPLLTIYCKMLWLFSRKEGDGLHCMCPLHGRFITTNNSR